MGASKTEDIVDKAWEARYSQDLESCHTHLAELKKSLNFPIGHLSSEMILSHFNALKSPQKHLIPHLQCLLLSASLVRSTEGVEKAELYIVLAEEMAHSHGLRSIFELSFQKGLNFSARGDFSSALESFVVSRLATTEVPLKAMALFNSYACLIHLGLSFEKTFAELKDILENLKETAAPTFLKNIIAQVQMAQAKQDFYSGQFSNITTKSATTSFSQLDYFNLWIQCLPYTPQHKATDELEIEGLVMAHPQFFQKSYRLRTLQGLLHPADLEKAVPLEQIDRIYHWTWKWLKDPQSFSISKILPLFDELDFSLFHKSSTNEDHQLLNNALNWLSLFSPASVKEIGQILSRISPPVNKSSFLEFEADCIRALQALRDQKLKDFNEIRQGLQSNPQWNSPEHFLSDLFQSAIKDGGSIPEPLTVTVKNLRKILKPSEFSDSLASRCLVVDQGNEQIYSSELQKSFQSEIMVCALSLLHQKSSVSCEEFLDCCFGIGIYDSFIHDAKIYNLLARMRALKVPNLKFGMKSGKVYAIGSWTQVQFILPLGSDHNLDHKIEWRSFISANKNRADKKIISKNDQWIRPQLLLRQLAQSSTPQHKASEALVPGEFTRIDVEKIAHVSRATANRILKTWREKGLIGERGRARSKVYYLMDQSSQRKNL